MTAPGRVSFIVGLAIVGGIAKAWLRHRSTDLAVPAVQVRVERIMRELLGPTARVGAVEFDERGDLASFEVTHEPTLWPRTAWTAHGGYRDQIERTFTKCMPGRWDARWDVDVEQSWVRFEARPNLLEDDPEGPR